jgi:hypothetical protein
MRSAVEARWRELPEGERSIFRDSVTLSPPTASASSCSENLDQFEVRTDLTVVTHFFDELRRRIPAPAN